MYLIVTDLLLRSLRQEAAQRSPVQRLDNQHLGVIIHHLLINWESSSSSPYSFSSSAPSCFSSSSSISSLSISSLSSSPSSPAGFPLPVLRSLRLNFARLFWNHTWAHPWWWWCSDDDGECDGSGESPLVLIKMMGYFLNFHTAHGLSYLHHTF